MMRILFRQLHAHDLEHRRIIYELTGQFLDFAKIGIDGNLHRSGLSARYNISARLQNAEAYLRNSSRDRFEKTILSLKLVSSSAL